MKIKPFPVALSLVGILGAGILIPSASATVDDGGFAVQSASMDDSKIRSSFGSAAVVKAANDAANPAAPTIADQHANLGSPSLRSVAKAKDTRDSKIFYGNLNFLVDGHYEIEHRFFLAPTSESAPNANWVDEILDSGASIQVGKPTANIPKIDLAINSTGDTVSLTNVPYPEAVDRYFSDNFDGLVHSSEVTLGSPRWVGDVELIDTRPSSYGLVKMKSSGPTDRLWYDLKSSSLASDNGAIDIATPSVAIEITYPVTATWSDGSTKSFTFTQIVNGDMNQ